MTVHMEHAEGESIWDIVSTITRIDHEAAQRRLNAAAIARGLQLQREVKRIAGEGVAMDAPQVNVNSTYEHGTYAQVVVAIKGGVQIATTIYVSTDGRERMEVNPAHFEATCPVCRSLHYTQTATRDSLSWLADALCGCCSQDVAVAA